MTSNTSGGAAPYNLAQSYLAQGWPVFPCRAKPEPAIDHATGQPVSDPETGELEMLKEKTPYTWNGFRSATIYPHIIDRWWRDHPDAMPGLPTGERIGAWVLDIDIKEGVDGYATLAALEQEHGALPDTARAKTASGGTHYYFRHVDGVRNRGRLGVGIDVRGDGGYVIAPGSVRADGGAYTWVVSPDDQPIADAPDWLLDLVVRKSAPASAGAYTSSATTNHAYVDAAVDKELAELASVAMGGGRNIELNKSAFCLGTFVGAGAMSESEARSLLQGVAQSWGRDWNLCCKTIENGLEAGKRQPRQIPARDEIDTSSVARLVANLINKVRETQAPSIAPTEITEDQLTAHATLPSNDNEPAIQTPERLTDVPGLVGDIVRWLTSSARNPCPILNLGAALSYVGALAGRRYEGPTGLRTNVYVVGLAPSGFGKEHPRAGTKALAAETNTLDKFFGGNKIASSAGLRNRVKKSPSLIYMIDEFGGFMRKVTSSHSGNHEKEIAEDLLEMTGTASSVFMGADYAQNLAQPIYNPNVCIYGTSTPDAFWKALGSGSIADGFLPRFIVLDAGNKRPASVDPKAKVSAPPKALVKAVQDLVAHRNGGNLNGMLQDGSRSIVPVQVAWGAGAKRVFDKFAASMFDEMDKADIEQEPVYARVAENAMRVATIVAVGVDRDRPEITAEIMKWGTELAHISCKMLLGQADRYVADNDGQAQYKRVLAIIGEGKRSGMRQSHLVRRLKGSIDRRRLDDILAMLVDAEEVVNVVVTPPNGGRKSVFLYLEKHAPQPEQKAA